MMENGLREPFVAHGFSAAHMQVLSTICDTFVPSLPPLAQIANSKHGRASLEEISAFYSESVSNCGILEQVASPAKLYLFIHFSLT